MPPAPNPDMARQNWHVNDRRPFAITAPAEAFPVHQAFAGFEEGAVRKVSRIVKVLNSGHYSRGMGQVRSGARGEVVVIQVNVSVPWGWLGGIGTGSDAAGGKRNGGNDGAENPIADHDGTDSNSGSVDRRKLHRCNEWVGMLCEIR